MNEMPLYWYLIHDRKVCIFCENMGAQCYDCTSDIEMIFILCKWSLVRGRERERERERRKYVRARTRMCVCENYLYIMRELCV
jgi:hypothetical protein